jgi:hypothetical protein
VTGCTTIASRQFIPPEACSAIPGVVRRALRGRSGRHHLGCRGFLPASEIASVELMVPVSRTTTGPHLTVLPEWDLEAVFDF